MNTVKDCKFNIPPKKQLNWLIRAIRLHHNSDKCLLWPFHTFKGYGIVSYCGFSTRVHRVAFRITRGYWPKPYGCHSCDVRNCFNPKHIWEGTPSDNQHDRVRKGRHRGPMAGGMPPGEGCIWAKLTVNQVRNIRKEYIPHIIGCDQLAKKYGVNQTAIYRIVKHITWRSVV